MTATAEATAPATRLIPYTDDRGVRHWVKVEGPAAAKLEAYDRWARRREKLFRKSHVLATDAKAERRTRPDKDRQAKRLVGFLNYELEAISGATGLRREAPGGPKEGPTATFTWLIGESPTWDGPAARVVTVTVTGPPGAKAVERTEYGVEALGPATCRRCRGMGKLPAYALCLDCCRCGNAEVEAAAAKARKGLS